MGTAIALFWRMELGARMNKGTEKIQRITDATINVKC